MVKFKGCSILFCLLFTIYLTSESVIIAPNCNTKLILEEVKTILEDKDLKKAFCGLPHYSTEYESTVQTIWTNLQTAGDLCDLKQIPYLQSFCNISDTKYLEFSLLWFFVSPILTNKEIKSNCFFKLQLKVIIQLILYFYCFYLKCQKKTAYQTL